MTLYNIVLFLRHVKGVNDQLLSTIVNCLTRLIYSAYLLGYKDQNLNSPREDSGIFAVQPSGSVSGSSTACEWYTKLASGSTYAVAAPEIDGQISSAHSTKSGLQGYGSRQVVDNTLEPISNSVRNADSQAITSQLNQLSRSVLTAFI